MKVKQLAKLLKGLDQNAVIDISSDEEGNSFGDIDDSVAISVLKSTKEKVYSLYPCNSEMPEEKYVDSMCNHCLVEMESKVVDVDGTNLADMLVCPKCGHREVED